jgi:hypothetical protein
MIVTNKRVKIPKSLDLDNIDVKIVDRFKLLGDLRFIDSYSEILLKYIKNFMNI